MNALQDAVRVAALQMNSGADVARNLETARALLARAREDGAAVAVLPENFAFMGAHEADKLGVAEEDGAGPIQDFLARAARELSLWIVAGTLPLRGADPSRVRAASIVYDARGKPVARYDKIHLFDVETMRGGAAEHYRESATIEPGAPQFVVVDSPAGRIGLSVCYDLRFPELYRGLAARGAEILAVPSAFTEQTGAAHWEVLLRARAVENQCYVVAPDQHGEGPGGRRTWGHSCIVDPWGQVLAMRDAGDSAVVAAVPREPLATLRERFPVLRHRRIDA